MTATEAIAGRAQRFKGGRGCWAGVGGVCLQLYAQGYAGGVVGEGKGRGLEQHHQHIPVQPSIRACVSTARRHPCKLLLLLSVSLPATQHITSSASPTH
jgi:hypothetical protein